MIKPPDEKERTLECMLTPGKDGLIPSVAQEFKTNNILLFYFFIFLTRNIFTKPSKQK